jgi:hypothetical protein
VFPQVFFWVLFVVGVDAGVVAGVVAGLEALDEPQLLVGVEGLELLDEPQLFEDDEDREENDDDRLLLKLDLARSVSAESDSTNEAANANFEKREMDENIQNLLKGFKVIGLFIIETRTLLA